MRFLTVVGTRPQVVKAAPVSRALAAAGHEEVLLHTGQHHDPLLAGVLPGGGGVPEPARHLGVGSGPHGARVAAAAAGIAAFARERRPAAVLAAGDTDSALAAALGARAAGIPLVHGEAGVRLGSLSLPEEVNRIVADHLAALLLCPTPGAAAAARGEGVGGTVVEAGDPLLDAFLAAPSPRPPRLDGAPLPPGYRLATLHRAENTDDPARLRRILAALDTLDGPVVLPLHPRTRAALARAGGNRAGGSLRLTGPASHGDLLDLLRGAAAVITDSGGLQREAFWAGVPCVVLREACEWRETVDEGWAVCVGSDPGRIRAAAAAPPRGSRPADRIPWGAGSAASRWVDALERRFG